MAAVSQEKTAEKPIQQFVAQAEAASGDPAKLVEVIAAALDCPDAFAFAELLQCPAVAALEDAAAYAPHLGLLRVFAHGTYLDYVRDEDRLPAMTAAQSKKLRYLTIVTLANRMKRIPYSVLLRELNVSGVRDLEDVIIEAVYSNVVAGELNQERGYLEVDWTVGRDVGPADVDAMVETLRQWCDSCESVLSTVQARIVDANRAKQEVLRHRVAVESEVASVKKAIRMQLQDEEMSVDTSGPTKKSLKSIRNNKFWNKWMACILHTQRYYLSTVL